jgi:hypothetical protein
MLVPLLTSLVIASGAICLSVNTNEEIVKVSAVVTAIICLFLSLFFAPMLVKLLILIAPVVLEKLKIMQFHL